MYFWNLLQTDDEELVKKVFNTQKSLVCKNDWVLQLRLDMEACNIILSEENIKSMKKESFKHLVNNKIKSLAKVHLLELRSSHSKSNNYCIIIALKNI